MFSELKDFYSASILSVENFLAPLSKKYKGICIPAYQRPYTWGEDSIKQLYLDIAASYNDLWNDGKSSTFIGAFIAVDKEESTDIEGQPPYYSIVDGQQRLTTIVLMAIFLHNRLLKHLVEYQSEYLSPGEALFSDELKLLEKLRPFLATAKKTLSLLQNVIGITIPEASFYQYERNVYWIYPRIIREANADKWSYYQDDANYSSPIAKLLHDYLQYTQPFCASVYPQMFAEYEVLGTVSKYLSFWETPIFTKFKQSAENADFLKTANLVFDQGKALFEASDNDDIHLRSLNEIVTNPNGYKALFMPTGKGFFEYAEPLRGYFESTKRKDLNKFDDFASTILFSNFLLKRVGITVVSVKNAGFEFDLFQALNTSGEPLTALETFKPCLMDAYGSQAYLKGSKASQEIENVENYFQTCADKQKETPKTIIAFAMAENGRKIGRSLREQRQYLNRLVEEKKKQLNQNELKDFLDQMLEHLRSLTDMTKICWDPKPGALSISWRQKEVPLCFKFLKDIDHDLMKSILVRYWHRYQLSDRTEADLRVFEEAVKASVAFAVLWRGANQGKTNNIENHLRNLCAGTRTYNDNEIALKRQLSMGTELLPVSELKAHYRWLLSQMDFGEKSTWVARAQSLKYTSNKTLLRFILMAALDCVVVDDTIMGEQFLDKRGKSNQGELFNYPYWETMSSDSIEHIAPQTPRDEASWDPEIYVPGKEKFDLLGNLTLLPQSMNSVASNRSWEIKREIYRILADANPTIVIDTFKKYDVKLKKGFEEKLNDIPYQGHLKALVNAERWDVQHIEKRGERLAELAWDKLYPWLVE